MLMKSLSTHYLFEVVMPPSHFRPAPASRLRGAARPPTLRHISLARLCHAVYWASTHFQLVSEIQGKGPLTAPYGGGL